MITAEEYQQRRNKLLKKLEEGVVIISGFDYRQMSNDVSYEFRQQTDLLYFTGFPEPNTIAVIENSSEGSVYHLFVPERDKEFEIWNGRRYGTEGAVSIFEADHAYVNDTFAEKLPDILSKHETVYYSMAKNHSTDEIILDAIQNTLKRRDLDGKGPITISNPIHVIHSIRNIKTEAEIELLRKAAKISAEAMTLGMKVTRPELSEAQVEAVIEYHFAKNGCDRAAYPSIVGGGVNATILHYIENKAELNSGELLLVDAGAEYQGYSADITRTWPINGRFNESQSRIYQLVLDIQKACINRVKPGIKLWDLQDFAIEKITEGLIELDLLKGEKEKIIDEKEYRRFFMHGLSHWLGMDVHDTSKVDRKTELLQPGQYFTIEPGIYIPNEDDIPEEFRGIGVRIEDDILVTEDGYENLTETVVKEIAEIEGIVGSLELP